MAVIGGDQVTIVDLTDGYTVVLAPEAYAFPASASAANAGSVPVLIQAFQGDNVVPASVTVANITGLPAGMTVTKDTNATTPTLTFTVTTAMNTTSGVVTIPVVIGDLTINKRFSYSLARTGAGGAAGISPTNVIIGNEATTIPTNSAGSTTGTATIVIPFAAYRGSTRNPVTVAATGLPSGMTVGTNTAATASADGSLTINVASGSNLGGATSGEFTLTFTPGAPGATAPQVKKFAWAKALGGTAGSDGEDAIVLAITSTNGTVFKNTGVATTLQARVYRAGAELSAAQINVLGTVKWYKDGGTTSVGTGVTLTLTAGMVTDKAVYEARLETA